MAFGITPPLGLGSSALELMIEAVKSVIALEQDKLIYPPPPGIGSLLAGCYHQIILNLNTTISITVSSTGELHLSLNAGNYFVSLPLYYRGYTGMGFLFQAGMAPTDGAICFVDEGAAIEGQYAVFRLDGEVIYMTFPSLFGADLRFYSFDC